MHDIEVDWQTLARARQTWLALSQDLRVAATTLGDATTGGFSPAVGPTVTSFIDVWAGAADDMATSAEELSDDVTHVVETFHVFETNVADELNKLDAEDDS